MHNAIHYDPSGGLCIEWTYRDVNKRCLEIDITRSLREKSLGSRASHERHKRLLVSSFDVPSRLRGVVDIKKKERKTVHEYASFMLTDTELKQREGTTHGSTKGIERAEGIFRMEK